MLKRYEMPECPIDVTLTYTDRYNLLIAHNLLHGAKRFSELKNRMGGVSQKVLTDHLRIMEENKLLTREVFATVPPRVEYSLTELGHSLKMILDVLREWGTYYKENLNK